MLPGKYGQLVKDGKVWGVANQAAVAITAALATAYTGLVIGNKLTSKCDLVLLQCGYSSTIAVPTATALGLMQGTASADVANALTFYNRYTREVSTNGIIAWAEDSCTLPGTPVLEETFATGWTQATTAGTLSQPNTIDLDGRYVLKPGQFLAFYSEAANTAAFLLSFLFAVEPWH